MKCFSLFCLALLGLQSAYGGADVSKSLTTVALQPGPFDKGMHEIDITGGFLYSPVIAKGNRPILNYGQGDVSLGWMLTSPSAEGRWNCLRGNWEALVNVFGAGVTHGPGGFLAGSRVLLRYNFVQPESKWAPFFQIGAGGLGDNVYNHQDQTVIGSGFEFTLVTDAGVRYFITPKTACLFMLDFEHISNAGTACRNLGINAAGATLGVSCFF